MASEPLFYHLRILYKTVVQDRGANTEGAEEEEEEERQATGSQ